MLKRRHSRRNPNLNTEPLASHVVRLENAVLVRSFAHSHSEEAMKLKLLASVAAAGLFAAGAASAEPNGWYGAIDAGYHMIDDINAESSTTGANWNYEVNDGWAAFARLGYRFNPNWRVELEGGYRSGDIGTVRAVSGTQGLCNLTPATGPCHSPEGDIESATLMANVIYDFGYEAWGIRPFVGLGAGVNRVNVDTIGALRANRGATFTADDTSTKFAAQAIAGLAWAIGDRANIDLTYRYLTGDAKFASTTAGTGVGATSFGEWDGDYDQSHTVTLGLRYSFGAEAVAQAQGHGVRLVVVAVPFAERRGAHARPGRRRGELGVARQIAVGQVDVGAVADGPGQTRDRLSGELGRGVVRREGGPTVGAQGADRVDVDAVHAGAQTHERADAPGFVAEVINDIGHQGGGFDVAFGRVARTRRRRQVAQALRARHGADRADVARAIAAFEFHTPVGVETIAQARKGGPAVVHFIVPVGARGRRLGVDVVDHVIAGVDGAVPTIGFRRCGAGCEQPGRGDGGEKFELHGFLTV